MSELKVGQTIKATAEGVITDLTGGTVWFKNDSGVGGFDRRLVDVKVLKEPTEVFKAGDRLLSLFGGSVTNQYTIGLNGYLSHSTGIFYKESASFLANEFTSENYKLIYRTGQK